MTAKASKKVAKKVAGKKLLRKKSLKKVEPLLPAEAMERLGVNQSTLYRFMAEGRFSYEKVGRYRHIDRDSFEKFASGYQKWISERD